VSDPETEMQASKLAAALPTDGRCRILSLDGGGAKGFYTLGVLKEIEGMLGCPLYKRFDLVFGTGTGAIIAALIALGYEVDEIHARYQEHVPPIMKTKSRHGKSQALQQLAVKIFGDTKFDAVKTGVGIVTTKWAIERPIIFTASVAQAHGRIGTIAPGFGCTIADAVQASCSAYPFFDRKVVRTESGEDIELIDGGYCANNPTLYAVADAILTMKVTHENIRAVSVGVGVYPEPKPRLLMRLAKKYLLDVQLLKKTLEINTQSMDQLRVIMFNDIPTVRISDNFERPEMATDLFEHDLYKLNLLLQRGEESFARWKRQLEEFLL
jgi:patatin-like phospholipase/acyl hydrolase